MNITDENPNDKAIASICYFGILVAGMIITCPEPSCG